MIHKNDVIEQLRGDAIRRPIIEKISVHMMAWNAGMGRAIGEVHGISHNPLRPLIFGPWKGMVRSGPSARSGGQKGVGRERATGL